MSRLVAPNQRIRIVHCIAAARLGAAEKQLAELIARLPDYRFEQCLLTIQDGGPLIEQIDAGKCPIISLGYEGKLNQREGRSLIGLWRAMGKLKRILIERKPHIVHGHLFWGNFFAARSGRKARVPRIVVSQRQTTAPKGRMQRWAENYCCKRASGILVNSDAMRAEIVNGAKKIEPGQIQRIYNGVVLSDFEPLNFEFQRRKMGLTPENFVITTVAHLHPSKGHEDLIEAVVKLRAEYPEIRVLLPGRDQGAGERLRNLILKHQLGPVVRLLGERTDIPTLLQLSDIVVHPSREEGFSNSILEAMAAGRAVIATGIGGNGETVRDAENGLIVPPQDSEALAAAIKRLIENPKLRRDMGVASRGRIENEFCMNAVVREHVKFYESLVE